MDAPTLILLGAIFLLIGIFVGRKLISRKPALPPSASPPPSRLVQTRARDKDARKDDAPPSRRAIRTEQTTAQATMEIDKGEIQRLQVRLVNCFGGNRGAMIRTFTAEWKKFPHLSEKELLEKMLYDFERGH